MNKNRLESINVLNALNSILEEAMGIILVNVMNVGFPDFQKNKLKHFTGVFLNER